MKFLSVVGARPQFVKAAVLSRALRQRHTEVLVHTGQHYDDLMSEVFFRELALPAPDMNLGIGSGTHGEQTGRAIEGLETVMLKQQPDCVIVYGDTNSTLAGALAAAKLNIPVAHVEAGLRSYDRSMPEEINRVVTDHVSSYLFCPTANAVACLKKEGIEKGVYEVGDLMYDSVLATLQRVDAYAPEVLQRFGLKAGEYFLATIHRASNTDDPNVLRELFMALGRLKAPVFLPLHPRTREALHTEGVPIPLNVHLSEPTGYLDMLALEHNARAVLTDSGGLQREAYFLSVACVTLREETEWPETLAGGWNVLAGCDQARIVEAAERPRPSEPPRSAFGDGRAATKIVEILERDPPYR